MDATWTLFVFSSNLLRVYEEVPACRNLGCCGLCFASPWCEITSGPARGSSCRSAQVPRHFQKRLPLCP